MRKEAVQPARDDLTKWWALAARLLLGGLFMVAGYSKASFPPEAFAASLEAYQLFPEPLLMPIAMVLPWVELLLGAFLVCGYFTRPAAAGLGALLGGFLLSLLSVIVRGLQLDSCGCYGAWGPQLTPHQAFAFDCVLAGLAVMLYLRRDDALSLDRWIGPASDS